MIKRNKYGNKKIVVNGLKFDSKLEHYCHGLLTISQIDFDFQHKIVLVEKFRFENKGVRAMTLIVDFVIRHGVKTIYLDTKGFATETSKLKYKLLKNKLKEDENASVVWLKNKKEVNEYINSLK